MRLKVLVIDDSATMRGMIMRALRTTRWSEFEFVEAADGVEGLARFNPEEIDAVFVDLHMPRLNGLDFIRQARARGRAQQVPMILVTSDRTEQTITSSIEEVGVTAFLVKPFTPADLDQRLRKVFEYLAMRAPAEAAASAVLPSDSVAELLPSVCQESVGSILERIGMVCPKCVLVGVRTIPVRTVAAVVTFFGDVSWSMTLVVPSETSGLLAEKFSGIPVDFDSPEMGDLVGEMANLLAGDIAARLEQHDLRVGLALPMVTRGINSGMLSRVGTPYQCLEVHTPTGPLWLRIAAVGADHLVGKRSGT